MSAKALAIAAAVVTAVVVTTAGHIEAAQLAKGPHHSIDANAVTCNAGQVCTVTITLSAAEGYHINKDYPAKLKLDELTGVEFQGSDAAGKNVFSKAAGDYTVNNERLATLTVKIKVAKAGNVTITGNFKFCVCSDKECVPDSAQLKVPVTVK
jgi:hypothetical protein